MRLLRRDPIGRDFYTPLGKAERSANVLFYATGIASIVALLIPKTWPQVLQFVEVAFLALSLCLFALSMAVRLHWAPRAHEHRVADLLSNSLMVSIVDEPSVGYYNNNQTEPIRRLNAAIMENAFFGKNIVAKMLLWERSVAASYVIIWIVALLNRSTDLAMIAVIAQVLLSEQVLSRWLRMEFLRGRLERSYRTAYALATMSLPDQQMHARTIENLTLYEAWKAEAGISLSTRVFERLNPKLSEDWKKIGQQAGVV
jgi:hypothetical protein